MAKKVRYRSNKKAREELQAVFSLRKMILGAGLIGAFGVHGLTFFWKSNFLLSVAAYMCIVTLLEVGAWVYQIKSWRFFGSLDFLYPARGKPGQFWGYIKSCRYIRVAGLLLAISASMVGYCFGLTLQAFVVTYITTTLMGIVGVRLFSNVVFPPLLEIRELTPEAKASIGVSMDEALAISFGLTGEYGNPYNSGRLLR